MEPVVFCVCTVNTCHYTANADLTITIGPGGNANPDCGCVDVGKNIVFKPASKGTTFEVIFDRSHPYYDETHRVQTGNGNTVTSDTTYYYGVYKYDSCYLDNSSAPCTDPKVIVKPVGMLDVSPAALPKFDKGDRQTQTVTDTASVNVTINSVEIKAANFQQDGGCTGKTLEAHGGNNCKIV
jgi:hypothetical protein